MRFPGLSDNKACLWTMRLSSSWLYLLPLFSWQGACVGREGGSLKWKPSLGPFLTGEGTWVVLKPLQGITQGTC